MMPEQRRKIQMIECDMLCTECGDGYMRPDGVVYAKNPYQYPHTCDNCGAKAVFDVSYPCIRYVYKDTGEPIKAIHR